MYEIYSFLSIAFFLLYWYALPVAIASGLWWLLWLVDRPISTTARKYALKAFILGFVPMFNILMCLLYVMVLVWSAYEAVKHLLK